MGGPREASVGPPMGVGLAIVTLVKGLIGAGLLGLPKAFGKVGLGLATPGCVVIGVLSVLGVIRLIETKLTLDKQEAEPEWKLEEEDSDTASTAESVAASGGDYGLGLVVVAARKLFGTGGVILAAVSVLGTQLGLGLAYAVFIHSTLVTAPLFKDQNEVMIRIGCCIIYCALSMLRKLNSLAMLSVIALAAYSFIIFDLAYRGWEPLTQSTNIAFEDAWGLKAAGFSSWFGSAVFAFEGIVLAQYVFEDMHLDSAKKFVPTLSAGYGICCALMVFAGVYGYLAYGDTAKVPIYLNFPEGIADTVLDKLQIVFILMISFALQMFPVFSFADSICIHQQHAGGDIISDDGYSEDDWQPHHTPGKRLLDASIRIVIVIVVCFVAAVLPKPGCVCDIVGNLFMSLMAFVLPGLLHLAAHKDSISVASAAFDIVLVLLGSTAGILGLIGAPACFAE